MEKEKKNGFTQNISHYKIKKCSQYFKINIYERNKFGLVWFGFVAYQTLLVV